MDIKPHEVTQAADAVKATVEAIRAAWTAIRDIGATAPDLVEKALREAEAAAQAAEAQLATALGYELCRCEFPPTPMLLAGYRLNGEPVHKCPKCSHDTAYPFKWVRSKDAYKPLPGGIDLGGPR